jgi:class 3 adenylate cyclase/YHS domain-containing protein
MIEDVPERCVAFVDLAGFTALTETHGDHDAADLAVRFASLAVGALGDGQRVVKSIGDAVMLEAPDPVAGVALVSRICERADAEDLFPVLRAGLHHGPVVERDGDLFGATVNLAARVAGHAAGDQVLATAVVADAVDSAGGSVRSIGDVSLRNMVEPVQLWEVEIGHGRHDRIVDPVCRMAIDRATAHGRLAHRGSEYWFCSLECAGKFAAAPDRYAASD